MKNTYEISDIIRLLEAIDTPNIQDKPKEDAFNLLKSLLCFAHELEMIKKDIEWIKTQDLGYCLHVCKHCNAKYLKYDYLPDSLNVCEFCEKTNEEKS